MTDLDQAIAELEADLSALRRARSVMAKRGGDARASVPRNGMTYQQIAPTDPSVTEWKVAGLVIFNDGKTHTPKDVQAGLKASGHEIHYKTMVGWLQGLVTKEVLSSPTRGHYRLKEANSKE